MEKDMNLPYVKKKNFTSKLHYSMVFLQNISDD